MSKKLFIKTFGCQMNVYDSDRMAGLLEQDGFGLTADLKEAELVLLNTCCVRQHAEDKVFSLLGKLEKLKQKNPSLKIVVAGCMAQLHGAALSKRFPGVNLVLGTDHISDLPDLLHRVEFNMIKKVIAIQQDSTAASPFSIPHYQFPITNHRSPGFVAIMRGCNRFCSYCIVPYVRGEEWSRPAEEIITEIENVVARGVKEVTLLGQNVNSYQVTGHKAQGKSLKPEARGLQPVIDFADLLKKIDKIQGLEKFSFITSHPGHFSDKLIETLPALAKFSREVHLPAQSGSDRILRLMRRGYTREEYLKLLAKLRQSVPDVRIGSDFIVGFPGETEEDFEQTCSLVREVKFSFVYMFKYSPRPFTMAGYLKDDVPLEVKKNRLARLLALQKSVRD